MKLFTLIMINLVASLVAMEKGVEIYKNTDYGLVALPDYLDRPLHSKNVFQKMYRYLCCCDQEELNFSNTDRCIAYSSLATGAVVYEGSIIGCCVGAFAITNPLPSTLLITTANIATISNVPLGILSCGLLCKDRLEVKERKLRNKPSVMTMEADL